MKAFRIGVVAFLSAWIGCATPTLGPSDAGSADAVSDAGDAGPDCPDFAKLVYVVDRDLRLSSFRPAALEFSDIGTLNCPVTEPTDHPLSMAVDRMGKAWVLYTSGRLFTVSTSTAACTATAFDSRLDGFRSFGMGFVTRVSGSREETFYVAGGENPLIDPRPPRLGVLDRHTLRVAAGAPLVGISPELTGTGDGKLWAFFAQFDAMDAPSRVARIDPDTGAESEALPVGQLVGPPDAWAFAFWGGDFFIFYKRAADPATIVYRLHQGVLAPVLTTMGRIIVGAGVSTCAPVIS